MRGGPRIESRILQGSSGLFLMKRAFSSAALAPAAIQTLTSEIYDKVLILGSLLFCKVFFFEILNYLCILSIRGIFQYLLIWFDYLIPPD